MAEKYEFNPSISVDLQIVQHSKIMQQTVEAYKEGEVSKKEFADLVLGQLDHLEILLDKSVNEDVKAMSIPYIEKWRGILSRMKQQDE